jgi:hypothetical protein
MIRKLSKLPIFAASPQIYQLAEGNGSYSHSQVKNCQRSVPDDETRIFFAISATIVPESYSKRFSLTSVHGPIGIVPVKTKYEKNLHLTGKWNKAKDSRVLSTPFAAMAFVQPFHPRSQRSPDDFLDRSNRVR